MSAPTLVVVAIVLGLVVGTSLVIGAPVFALPFVAIAILVLGLGELRRRRDEARSMKGLRDQAKTDPVEFTARDKQTTVETAE